MKRDRQRQADKEKREGGGGRQIESESVRKDIEDK